MNTFIKKRIKSIRVASKGAYMLIKTEDSIKVQLGIGIIISLAGIYVDLNPTEWMIQTLVIGMIISLEGLNTAIEKTTDFIHPDHNPHIKLIKDIAAGAVYIMAIVAVIIGCVIYIPKLF